MQNHSNDPDVYLAHHFDNIEQQHATIRIGMWLFLVTEVLFFAGAFCAYTAFRMWFPNEFEAGSSVLNVGIAAINTFLLLFSSFTATLAARACANKNYNASKIYLILTIALGTLFLCLKAREYQIDYIEGLIPTTQRVSYVQDDRVITESRFVAYLRHALDESEYKYVESTAGRIPTLAEAESDLPRVDLHKVQLFFVFYYAITGLHVIHMIIGLGLLTWQFVLLQIGFFSIHSRHLYMDVTSMYWHFVDLVWMFVFPMLYLAGTQSWSSIGHQIAIAFGGGH